MTPHERAVEIFEQYFFKLSCHFHAVGDEVAKQCALIAVDEMLEEILENWYGEYINIEWEKERIEYWNEVRNEIEKL